MILPITYYRNSDVLFLSQDLLGKYLMTQVEGELTGGMIIETEAYRYDERACHAYGNKKTKRNAAMFSAGGICYVYLCYGIHPLLNIVTFEENSAEAILIRAILPSVGIETMERRRKMNVSVKGFISGPGTVTKALAITTAHNSTPLDGSIIWIEEKKCDKPFEIISGPRIGVDYAGEDALLPWRYRIKL